MPPPNPKLPPHGFIRLKHARWLGQAHTVLRQAKAGTLTRVRPGLYRPARLDDRLNQDLLDACAAVPAGVICLVSALYHHGLTTTLPKEVWIAIPRNAYAPVMDQPCRLIRMGDGIRQAGVERIILQGRNAIPMFGKAVSVCQALHYRNLIGLDLAFEALRTYIRQGGSIRDLEQWAGVCRIRRTLAHYLEATLQ